MPGKIPEVVQYISDPDADVSLIVERTALGAAKVISAIRIEGQGPDRWHLARFIYHDEKRNRDVYRILGTFDS
jgi:hypothetical protein